MLYVVVTSEVEGSSPGLFVVLFLLIVMHAVLQIDVSVQLETSGLFYVAGI
jgi:hypothetical protein